MSDVKDYGHLKEVPKVKRLHNGKQHLGSLGDRIMGVIEDFTQQAHDQDVQITYAEVLGTLRFVEHNIINAANQQYRSDRE